jgi:hypothetical protein
MSILKLNEIFEKRTWQVLFLKNRSTFDVLHIEKVQFRKSFNLEPLMIFIRWRHEEMKKRIVFRDAAPAMQNVRPKTGFT